VQVDFTGGALDIFVRVELEDKLPSAGALDSSSDEGLAVLARSVSLSGDVQAST